VRNPASHQPPAVHGGPLVINQVKELTMDKFLNATRRFLRDEEGVTAIEYGLIAALIAVVIIGSVALVGTELDGVFDTIQGCLANPTGC
jgi:pilus assembly protein Flp/PilA